ncbi:LacI family DNA-binding transcriptional regulator [Nesterenkonia sedimenti]|uniref:LacI family DNA-binding transcriptional regulator n=1 Tax=Nesterenkonia sedimenti TaxID=1463632 RepID=UPI001B3B220A|nr:LacI family DNA-binding transcriptional regulator [Nesterenkonia sedimenti]
MSRGAVVSLDEVARAAGVSSATASRALSGRGHVSPATRQKVSEAAKALGYVVSSAASSLASGRSRSIGVITPDLHRWFFNSVLTGISDTLTRAGYDLTLYNVTSDPQLRREIFRAFLRRRRVDGVIVVALELDDWETEQLQGLGMPVAVLGGRPRQLPGMAIDDQGVTRLAAEHLLTLGHHEIGYIGGDQAFDMDYHVPTQRREGFNQALQAQGIDPAAAAARAADFTIEGGYDAAKQLFGAPGSSLTGLVAASDEMAIGAMIAAKDLGIQIPQQVSVVGVDGHELGTLFGLTTVDQHPVGQGRIAAEHILARVVGEGGEESDLPFELVVRSSTAAPAESGRSISEPSG